MKSAIGVLCLGLALTACGQPAPAPVAKAPPLDPTAAAAELFDSGDWTLIGGKCLSLLELPANAGLPENDKAHRRWLTWLEKTAGADMAAQMVALNTPTLASTPEPTLVAAASFCRTKIAEVWPET
jgi:hypothetical protein